MPEEMQKKLRKQPLPALHLIALHVSQAKSLNEAIHTLVCQVREALQVDVCSIYLTEPASGNNLLMASDGLNPGAVGTRLQRGEGLVGLVAERSESVNVSDAPEHPSFKLVPEIGEEPYHAFLGVPVIHQGEHLGVLVVQQAVVRKFGDSEVAFLATLSAQIAGSIALAKARGILNGSVGAGLAVNPYIEGVAGAPGIAIGTAVVFFSPAELAQVPDRKTPNPEGDIKAFLSASEKVVADFRMLGTAFQDTLDVEERALFDAYAMLASSDTLVSNVVERIQAGNWPPGALRTTIEEYAGKFESMESPYFRERANDIRHIGQRLLFQLLEQYRAPAEFPQNTILVGENLSPIDLAEVPVDRLAGVVSGRGSSMSHLAILARALGLPAVMGIEETIPVSSLDRKQLIVDGHQGRLFVEPKDSVRREFARSVREERSLQAELEHLRDLPAETADGYRVRLYANGGLTADFSQTESVGAEGIGLYRTELMFMVRERFPTEEEQYALYSEVLKKFAPRPVTMRTLDIGGDKSLSYFPIQEENPYLGWRGIRVSLDHPEIFLTQLRAMLRAGKDTGNLNILLPMVNSVDDVDKALALIHQAHRELNEEGIPVAMPRCGLMIEVPSAVFQAEALARKVDFLSIGTNDLVQYLLAVDRGNERVSKWYDSLHPAVLHAVKQTVDAGRRCGKPVSVCGQTAGDPVMALLLLGMGVDSLSLSANDLPKIKWLIRSFSLEQARECLGYALDMEQASAIREMLVAKLVDAGVGGLIPMGK